MWTIDEFNSTVGNNFNKNIPTIKSQQLFLFQIMTTLDITFITFILFLPFQQYVCGLYAWQATVHGVAGVGQDLVTKPINQRRKWQPTSVLPFPLEYSCLKKPTDRGTW